MTVIILIVCFICSMIAISGIALNHTIILTFKVKNEVEDCLAEMLGEDYPRIFNWTIYRYFLENNKYDSKIFVQEISRSNFTKFKLTMFPKYDLINLFTYPFKWNKIRKKVIKDFNQFNDSLNHKTVKEIFYRSQELANANKN